MPDTIIESVLKGKLDFDLLVKWLSNESIENAPDDCILLCCTRSEFVAYFLTYLRTQTDSILQTNSNAVHILQNATPEKLLNSTRIHHRSISEPTSDDRTDSLSVKDSRSHHESPNRDKKRTGRRVKTKLFTEDKNNSNISSQSNFSSDESRLSTSVDKLAISSTPMKNGCKPDFVASPVTPRSFTKDSYERCDTPRLTHRHSRSHEKSCLGDYLITATKTKKKVKKNTSNDNETEKVDLDLSNSEIFPEIGARKASSLRADRRRIKPTNIDYSQKSLSLNSFNTSECFQQPSPLALEDNSIFKQQKFQPKESANSFEAERSLLKQERHKLMEKFNILNTATPAKSTITPHIKITQKESIEITATYTKTDVTKILMKDKIDTLVDIYDLLLRNNLILSINTEIYFLISILVSKQLEDDYINIERELNNENIEFLLKSIHNSTYFAVKSLWNQRIVLEVILDKNSLKTLGENKKVRSFYPELAKFLLNCYCVRCEQPPIKPTPRAANIVNYNCETDNVENFPSAHAFHLFKKQRDMFYDIVRWYQDTVSTGGSHSSFRARVKPLFPHTASAANHAHLAALTAHHMLQQCEPHDTHESKLSKLQRRLTCPAATDSNRLPHFTANEMFYKEFITHADNEAFRVHLRDALASEIIALDGTHIAVEDRGNSNNLDITREYLQLAKKLALLAKFLGFLSSLAYSQVPTELAGGSKANNNVVANNYTAPKEKVLENNIGLRNYSQPNIDLKGLLNAAIENYRLSITVPWLVHYLSMLDYTTLRLRYYSELLRTLYEIYYNKLKLKQHIMKKNTVIYLKSILGWLFDLSHFPNDEISRCNSVVVKSASEISDGVDCCDVVDESTILELCPCLKEVNTLLSTCRLSQENRDVGSFRHITPVSLTVNPEDRIKNKEKELQARLEEELLKSQPSSTRRVLEMVVERVTSAIVKELTARELVTARERAREHARRALQAAKGENQASLLQTTTSIYTAQLQALKAECLSSYAPAVRTRTMHALGALLPSAPRVLHALAAKMSLRALATWLRAHTDTPAILCKDIEAEMRTLISMNDMQIPVTTETAAPDANALAAPTDAFAARHGSVATPLIYLKEHICLLLDGSPAPDVTSLLASCRLACSSQNIFSRAPAQRALLHLTVDLCLVYVSRNPNEINDSLLGKFHAVWNTCCPDRKHYAPEDISLPERRYDISPELRNFEDDERMPTPISDEEIDNTQAANGAEKPQEPVTSTSQPTTSNPQPIACTSQPTISTAQPMTLTQVLNSKPSTGNPKLLQINTKVPTNTRSQPASPMLQPMTTKWPTTSRSQPVSPKIQTIVSTWQPLSPILKPQPTTLVMAQPSTPASGKQQPATSKNESDVKENDSDLLEVFDRILCPRNIVLLSVSKCDKSEVWEAMASVLVFLLKNDYLSEDSLTEQCLAVYRQDWSQGTLESLSSCMKSVSSRWSRASSGKFTLFLDFLAEYCGDMDYDTMQLE